MPASTWLKPFRYHLLPLYAAILLAIVLLGAGGAFLVAYGGPQYAHDGLAIIGTAAATGALALVVLVGQHRRTRAAQRLLQAQQNLRRGRPQAALDAVRALLAAGRLPKLAPTMLFLLAKAHEELDQPELALKSYALAGNYWPAKNNLATLKLEAGDARGAITTFIEAIALNPREPLLYNQLALTYQRLDEPTLARQTLERCLELATYTQGTRGNLARLDAGLDIQVDHMSPRP